MLGKIVLIISSLITAGCLYQVWKYYPFALGEKIFYTGLGAVVLGFLVYYFIKGEN